MGTDKYCTIYLVRHGETSSNVNKIIDGHFNAPLTEKGREQARVLKAKFKEIVFDAAFSSDLTRAKETAEIVVLERQLALNTSNLLRERFYGVYEGKPAEQYVKENQTTIERLKILTEPEKRKFKLFDTIESEEEMMARFNTALREIAVTYLGKTVLVVTHGSMMRTFLIHLGAGNREDFGTGTLLNTAYIRLESDGVDFFVKDIIGHQKNNIIHYT